LSLDQKAIARPDYAEAWMHRGITLANLRRFRDGLDSLNKAIEFKPDYSKAWMHHGITLGKSGGKEEKQEGNRQL
jgi:cytochrome c-type biogenesis protein CcmH/NrfG